MIGGFKLSLSKHYVWMERIVVLVGGRRQTDCPLQRGSSNATWKKDDTSKTDSPINSKTKERNKNTTPLNKSEGFIYLPPSSLESEL